MSNMATSLNGFDCEIFHAADDYFDESVRFGRTVEQIDLRTAFAEGKYHSVAHIKMANLVKEQLLEDIFCRSQNFELPWNQSNSCRPTSVGDIIRIDNDYWIVAGRGFRRLC